MIVGAVLGLLVAACFAPFGLLLNTTFGNAQRASRFEYQRNLAKLGRPVDRGEWVMNPQLVDAVWLDGEPYGIFREQGQ